MPYWPGREVANPESFNNTLNDLWQRPVEWKQMGARGRDYVANQYSSPALFAKRIEAALAGLATPLAELMRQRGRARAKQFTPQTWSERFAERIENVLHRDLPQPEFRFDVTPPRDEPGFCLPLGRTKLTIQLSNAGNLPLLPDGPAEGRVWAQVFHGDGESLGSATSTRLPGIVVPGQSLRLAVNLKTPVQPGDYQIGFFVGDASSAQQAEISPTFHLCVTVAPQRGGGEMDAALAEAETLAALPVGYTDVSEGLFAKLKRKLKRALLHQFQVSYVDALSRQQSAFNRTLLSAMQELSECTAMLEQTILGESADRERRTETPDMQTAVRRLSRRVREAAGKLAELEQRLERLEKREQDAPAVVVEEPR